jgi:hypothetical protein
MLDNPKRSVFVVHGRNLKARDEMYAFLIGIGLSPMTWDDAIHLGISKFVLLSLITSRRLINGKNKIHNYTQRRGNVRAYKKH